MLYSMGSMYALKDIHVHLLLPGAKEFHWSLTKEISSSVQSLYEPFCLFYIIILIMIWITSPLLLEFLAAVSK